MEEVQRKIDRHGRIAIPRDFRNALGLEADSEVMLGLEKGTMIIRRCEKCCKLCGFSGALVENVGICTACVSKIRSI